MAEKAEAIGRTITRICEINSVICRLRKRQVSRIWKARKKVFCTERREEIRAQWGWRADERAWRADISAQFWSNVCINFGIVFILVFVWAWVPIKWHWHNHSQKRQKSLTFLTSDCRETPVLPEQNWGFYVNNWKWAIQNKSNTKDNAPSISVWVNPKFCVKSILGANRAKLICGGSRLVRLPPW